jgi:hypothetical protein
MAEFDVSTGSDTFIQYVNPTVNHALDRFPAVKSGAFELVVFVPLAMSRIGGLTIVSATLSAPAQTAWVSQTLTAQAIAGAWDVATVNKTILDGLGVVGATATVATGVLAAGARWEMDVTALVQAIADGQPNYGWKITTSQSTDKSTLRGFDSGFASWVLHLEVSDIPSAPTQLSPAGVIGTGAWVVTVDETDDMAAINVQVDADATGAPDFDSGWVTTTTPQLDLSATAMTPIANNATTNYRARVKLTDGAISDWSDWVEVTRVDQPAIVIDSYDLAPTPRIQAHLSPAGDADTRWQVIVTDPDDPSDWLYDSGDALLGAALDHTIPLTWNGRTTLPADGDYRIEIRALDRFDRVSSAGVPTTVRDNVTVSLATVGTVAAPATLTATPVVSGYPDVTLVWTRATSAPDEFVILRDGLYIDVIDPDDYLTGTLTWTYVDTTADPSVTHTYAVRAKNDVSGVQKMSADSPTADATPTLEGVWLRSRFGDVMLRSATVDGLKQTDKRQTFVLPYRLENVDIVTAIGGYEGSITGALFSGFDQDVDAARAILEQLRQAPMTEVRLAWGTQNRPVYLRGLSVKPHPQMTDGNRGHVVEFEFFEITPAA